MLHHRGVRRGTLAAMLLASIALTACGGSDDDNGTATPSGASSSTSTSSSSVSSSAASSSVASSATSSTSSSAASSSSVSSSAASSSSSSSVAASSSSSSVAASSSSSAASSSVASSSSSSEASSSSSSSAASSSSEASSSSSSAASSSSSSAAATYTWSADAVIGGSSATTVSGTNDLVGTDLDSYTGVMMNVTGGKLESSKDSLYFVSTEVTGDFTLVASLDSVSSGLTASTSHQYRAGLMMADSNTTSMVLYAQSSIGDVTADSTVNYVPIYAARLTSGSVSKAVFSGSPAATPGSTFYLKLQRIGNTYMASYSSDGGVTYTNATTNPVTFTATLPATVRVGVFAAPGGSSANTLVFKNIQITKQ
jgi:hypothetical protein